MFILVVHRCDYVYTSRMHDIVELGLVRQECATPISAVMTWTVSEYV